MKTRVPETDQGIVGEFSVSMYDQMQRNLRDRGWIETKALLKSGIGGGHALELGSGPGYLGLEWLRSTQKTTLTGLDISPDMIALAQKNAREYGLEGRTSYVKGSGSEMPFDDCSFDFVFTNGSLHEWVEPRATFDQIWACASSRREILHLGPATRHARVAALVHTAKRETERDASWA